MGVYSAAVRTLNTTTASPVMEIVANAVVSPRLIEISIFPQSAIANAIGLGRPAAVGVGPVSPVTVQPENLTDPAGQTQLSVQWATAATAPAAFVRRATFSGSVAGIGIIWTFPRGIIVSTNKTLVVWNLTTGSIMCINVTVVE